MARARRPSDTPLLFDLPLAEPAEAPPEQGEPRPPAASPAPAAEAPRLFAEEWPPLPEDEPWPAEPPSGAPSAVETAAPARLTDRLRAGLADLAVHVAAGLAGLIGAELLGARPDVDDLPALALYLAAFSFLYTVVPLAFWGHTPGMAWAGLASRSRDGEPLAFGQTVRRWLGGLLTVATLGLPLLLALSGRSLADRLSGSRTWREEVG
jgi:uncharacterized RDD family membrane protein YckC